MRRVKKTAKDLSVMLTLLQSQSFKQPNYPTYPRNAQENIGLAVAEVSWEKKKKDVLQVPVHFSTLFFFCFCTYVFIYAFYYKIARIKLLASLPSFRDARVKAVSVKKINYLYRCVIEASSKL